MKFLTAVMVTILAPILLMGEAEVLPDVPIPYFELLEQQYTDSEIQVLRVNTNLITDQELRQVAIEDKFDLFQKFPLTYRNAQVFLWDDDVYIRKYSERVFSKVTLQSRAAIIANKRNVPTINEYYYLIADTISTVYLEQLNIPNIEWNKTNSWHTTHLNKSDLDSLSKYGVIFRPYNRPPFYTDIVPMQSQSERNIREVLFSWSSFTNDIGDPGSGEPWVSYDLNSADEEVYWDDNLFESHYRAYCADGGDDPAWTVYANNMDAWLDMDSDNFMDISNIGPITYSFSLRYESEANYDWGVSYLATNDYSSFLELETYTGYYDGWQPMSYEIDNNASAWSELELTFLFHSDFSGTDLGMFVDDILVEGDPGVPPPPPDGLTASDDECGQITIDWNTVVGASNYKVYRDGTFLADDSNPPYVNNTTGSHSYYVKAENDYGLSGSSNSDTGTSGSAPSPPSGVAASDDDCGQICVDWNTVTGATNYKIYKDGSYLTDDSNPPYCDNTSGSHTYYVKAENSCGTSGSSNSDSGTSGSAPSPPSGVAASDDDCGQICIDWNTVTGATNYKIYKDGSYLTDDSNPPYCDNTSGSHTYYVKAENSCGTSGSSNSDSGTSGSAPSPPSGVAASDDDCGQICIDWNTVTGATNYKIYKDGSYLADDSNPPYCDNTSGSHTYYVKAENSCGTSSSSNSDSGTSGSAPSPPSGVAASDDDCGQITVDWETVTGATTYKIYRDDSYLGEVDIPPYVDNAAGAYTYYVKAENVCGSSSSSNSDTGTSLEIPSSPNNVSASGEICNQITVNWNSVEDASNYQIYRDGNFLATYSETEYVDEGISGSHSYYVKAENDCGISGNSIEVNGIGLSPIEISGITATVDGVGYDYTFSAEVSWESEVDVVYDWDFGDGSAHSSQSGPAHTYSGDASLTVTLTMSYLDASNDNCTASVSLDMNVVSIDIVEIPEDYNLNAAYPNPFNPSTTITYGIPENSSVSLKIYDSSGRVVRTLVNEPKSAGWYSLQWNGTNANGNQVSTGLYFAGLQAGRYSKVIKMLYLK